MISLLERILIIVYRFYIKRKFMFFAWRKGYKITNFEWLPPDVKVEKLVRITPNDGFEHARDDCICNPKRYTDGIKGTDYNILEHRVMT
jgi:hypothetical protein